ncbi:tigger transposable element-derived protein 6-like [Schistocerca gregaria]|uniref:tigger transposable element-derived protein 6-like n=1 Tax=Schistocerca gregaria TaxID=7010 RepID=UPI00211EDCBD|nr:tigger transposable element-derived protein 6-like [Schistocerca gregaria]
MAKRKLTALNVQLKLKILNEVDHGTEKKAIAQQFGIPKSTLSTIIKNREKIIHAAASGSGNKSKRCRTVKYEKIDTILLEWFSHMRASNIPLTGPVIQSKANDIAKDMSIKDFRCSAGWLSRIQRRQSISSLQICGEANEVDEESANNWLHEFYRVREKYASCDVFNMAETGFFYNLFPNHTLGAKGDKCHGGARSEQRVTVVLCCNADGSEKFRPWIIGKSGKPSWFKNINMDTLPCIYSHHQKAWIDGTSFGKWIFVSTGDMFFLR